MTNDARKLVERERRITDRLRAFARSEARSEALRVIHLWDAPPVVREYLETGRDVLRASAEDAAMPSARAAAEDAARASARATSAKAEGRS